METIFCADNVIGENCADKIRQALGRQPGVTNIAVEVSAGTITVQHDEARINGEEITALLDAIGCPARVRD